MSESERVRMWSEPERKRSSVNPSQAKWIQVRLRESDWDSVDWSRSKRDWVNLNEVERIWRGWGESKLVWVNLKESVHLSGTAKVCMNLKEFEWIWMRMSESVEFWWDQTNLSEPERDWMNRSKSVWEGLTLNAASKFVPPHCLAVGSLLQISPPPHNPPIQL